MLGVLHLCHLLFCCVSLELNGRFRNYPIVPTILRNVACKFRNYPMVSTIPIMCACTGFLLSNRVLYGTYTAYSTRNSFNPVASWGPECALESGFENPGWRSLGPRVRIGIWIRKPRLALPEAQSPHWNLDSKTPTGAPWDPESALESGFQCGLGPPQGGGRVRIGIWIRKPHLAPPGT